MSKTGKFQSLEEGILLVQRKAKSTKLSIGDILHILSGKGRFLILILLSLPFCQPVQIPGLSTPFGFAIAFFGLRITFGKRVWLPSQLLAKNIPSRTLTKITRQSLRLVRKMKRWIHPRLTWACHAPLMKRGNGLIICILGVFLALPLPIPLSNLAAAWSILLIALGTLEDDGLFVLIGYVASLLTIAFFLWIALEVKAIF